MKNKQRYEYYKGTTSIIDNETNELIEDVVDILNQKDYIINELLKIKHIQEERMQTHKYNLEQEVYYLDYKYKFETYISKYLTVCKGKILDIIIREENHIQYNFSYDDFKWIDEENVFISKELAQLKLQSITK